MQTTIRWKDGYGVAGAYCEYIAVVSYQVSDGVPGSHDHPGELPLVVGFELIEIESLTVYPAGSDHGLSVPLTFDDASQMSALIRDVNAAMQDDAVTVFDAITEAFDRERMAA